ncbi:MAG: LacI family DNA-binding transcriptional regulator [Victivallales bacterium]|jgi:LacI family transcriptional regulator
MISSMQLARKCGVSQGTVDRAVHNRGGISPETRRRILEAAEKFAYLANPAAREIMTGKSLWAGAVIPSLTSLFFSDLFEAVGNELGKTGIRLLLTTAADDAETIAALRDFASRRAKCAIIVPPDEELEIPAGISGSMPVFSLANPSSGKKVINIYPDETGNGFKGAEYLIQKGHSRIIFISYTRKSSAVRDRIAGYRDCMLKNRLEPVIMAPLEERKLIEMCHGSNPPTAIFCHNDWLALNAMRLLQKEGFKVPGDVSILGIDNSPSFNMLCPGISTMEYPCSEIAEMISSAMRNQNMKLCRLPTFKIMERETVRKYA